MRGDHSHPAAGLRAVEVGVRFSGVQALQGVTLQLEPGEILGLIGPNGAGKSTLTNVLSGFQYPTEGRVVLDGTVVNGLAPHRLARLGIARTFQGVRSFAQLSVLDSVFAAASQACGARDGWARAQELVEEFGLTAAANRQASSLSLGEERRVELARTLATRPTYLLLDEPAAGLNEAEGERLVETIRRIRETLGCGVLLIEHDIPLVSGVCDRIHVLDHGQTLTVGPVQQVMADSRVHEAYLGVPA